VNSMREESHVPVFLNADHTHSLAKAIEAAKAGFDSVVVDFSGGWATLRRKYNPDRSLNVDHDNLWVRPFSRFPRRGLLNSRHRFPCFTKQLEWRHSTRFSRKLALFCRSPERSRGGSPQVGRPTADAIPTRNLLPRFPLDLPSYNRTRVSPGSTSFFDSISVTSLAKPEPGNPKLTLGNDSRSSPVGNSVRATPITTVS
jgi:hypothetical protein